MKIAVFYNLPDGGAKRILFEELRYLSTNHIIEIYRYNVNSSEPFDFKIVSKNIYQYDFDVDANVKGIYKRLKNDYKLNVKLRQLHQLIAEDIHKRSYDVVLVHPDLYTETPFLLRYLTTPSLYYCEELLRIAYEQILELGEGKAPYKKLYDKWLCKVRKTIDMNNAICATKISTSSFFMQNQINRAYKRSSTVCYPGVNLSTFKKSAKTTNKILFIGNRDKIDGYPLLKEIEGLVDSSLNIDILDFKKGKAKIKNDKHMSREYSESVCTLCLDYFEPFGLKATESMACETPVLAVNDGGYKETVVDGVTGFLLPRDPKVFVEKIEWLVKHPEKEMEMGEAGREHVKDNFSWEKHGSCIEKLLKGISIS